MIFDLLRKLEGQEERLIGMLMESTLQVAFLRGVRTN